MEPPLEIPIPPWSWGEMALSYFLLAVVVIFTALSVFDLITLEAVIAPLLWFGVLALMIGPEIERAGDYRKWAIRTAGVFLGREFVGIAKDGEGIGIECELFGRRYSRWSVPLDKIISLECSAGQATAMSKRDCHDWHAALWFEDPAKKRSYRSGQAVRGIGPSRRKVAAEKFCHAIAELLQRAGLAFERGEDARNIAFPSTIWKRK